jgi:hypothetical protein
LFSIFILPSVMFFFFFLFFFYSSDCFYFVQSLDLPFLSAKLAPFYALACVCMCMCLMSRLYFVVVDQETIESVVSVRDWTDSQGRENFPSAQAITHGNTHVGEGARGHRVTPRSLLAVGSLEWHATLGTPGWSDSDN